MPRTCTICSHAQRPEIDRALMDGTDAIRRIASRYGLVETSVRRHKQSHIPLKLLQSTEARERLEADSLLDRLRLLNRESLAVLQAAKQSKQHQLTLQAIARLEAQIALEGKLLGQLADVQINVNLAVSPEWLALRSTLLRALEPYPDARQAVVTALGGSHEIAG